MNQPFSFYFIDDPTTFKTKSHLKSMSKTQAQHIRQENGYDNNPNYKYRYEHEPKSGYNSKYDHKIKNSSDPKYGHMMRSPDTGMAPGVSSAMKTPMEKQGLIRISNQSQSEMKAPVVVTASTPVHKVMKMVHADRSQESLGDHYGCESDRNITPLARRIFTSPDTHPPRHTDSYHYGVQSSRSHHIEQMPSSRRHHYMTGQDHVYHERLRDPSVSRHEVEYHGHYSEIEQKQLQQRRSLSVTPSSARHHSSHHEAKFTSPHPPSLAYYRERNEAIHPDELRERDPRSYRELERAFVPDRKFERKHLRQNSIERGTLELHDHHHSHYLPSTDEPKYARDYRPSEVIPSEVIDNRKPSHPKHSSESQSRTSPHQHHNQHSYDHANEKNDEATQKQAPKGDSENVKNEDPSKTSSTSSTKPNYSNDTESEIRRELNSPVRRSRGTDTDGFNNEKSGRIVSQTASSIYRSSSIDREESDHFLRRSKHHSFHENGPSESMAYQNDADQSRSRYLERSTNHARAPQYQNTESVHNYHRSRYVTLSPTRGAPYHKGLYNGPHPAYEHGHRHDLPMSHMEDKENIEYRNKLKRTSPPYGNPPHYSSQKYHPQHYHEPLHNSTNHKYHHTPSLHTQDHEVKLSASPIERDMSRERDYAPAYYVQDFRPPPYHIEGGLPPPRYREEYRPHHCQYEEEKYYHSRSHRYPRDEEYERYPQNDLHSKHHGYHSNHSPYYHRPRKLSLANNPEEMEDYYSRRDMKELPKQQSQTLSTKVMSKVHSPSLPQSKKRKSEGKTPAAPVSQRKRKKMYSDFVGVTYNKTHAKFQACITHYRKQHYLGRYKLAVDAAKAYDESARLLKGKGWKINFKTEEDYLLAKKKEEEKNIAVSKMGNTEDETMEGKDENIEEIVDENMIEGSEVSTVRTLSTYFFSKSI